MLSQPPYPFKKIYKLVCTPGAKNKGKEASARTIASWMVKLSQRAYRTKGLNPHSSVREVASSWAARAIASVDNLQSSNVIFSAHS